MITQGKKVQFKYMDYHTYIRSTWFGGTTMDLIQALLKLMDKPLLSSEPRCSSVFQTIHMYFRQQLILLLHHRQMSHFDFFFPTIFKCLLYFEVHLKTSYL